jgi:hypothetical protein
MKKGSNGMEYSISPEGEKFKIPDEEDYRKEYARLEKLARTHRKEGEKTCARFLVLVAEKKNLIAGRRQPEIRGQKTEDRFWVLGAGNKKRKGEEAERRGSQTWVQNSQGEQGY